MRPTWDDLFIKTAIEISKRSTCLRMKVGAILVKDTRIISMGYNGVTPGRKHCEDYFHERYQIEYFDTPEFLEEHGKFSIRNEVHAEMNLLAFAAKIGIKVDGATLYVTNSPCINCSKVLCVSGIVKVFYHNKYDRGIEGVEFLEENGISCIEVPLSE